MMSLAELIVNVLKGNLKISSKTCDILSRSKVILRKLAKVRRPSHAIHLFNKHYRTVVTFLKHCLPRLYACLKGKSPSQRIENIHSDINLDNHNSRIHQDEYYTTSKSLNSSDTSMKSHSSTYPTNEVTKAKHACNEVDMCNVINRSTNDHDLSTVGDLPNSADNSGTTDYYSQTIRKRKALSMSSNAQDLKKNKDCEGCF